MLWFIFFISEITLIILFGFLYFYYSYVFHNFLEYWLQLIALNSVFFRLELKRYNSWNDNNKNNYSYKYIQQLQQQCSTQHSTVNLYKLQ